MNTVAVIVEFVNTNGEVCEYHFPTYDKFREYCRTEEAKHLKWTRLAGTTRG